MGLTLFVVPADLSINPKFASSFNKVVHEEIFLGSHQFNHKASHEWKMFMYEGEWLSDDLKEAIPVLLKLHRTYDYFSFYKLARVNGELKPSKSPRLFRNFVRMREDSVYPVNIESLRGETILDGFILG